MTFNWEFKAIFAEEFERLPQDQQDKVFDFTDIYEAHGLADFKKYPGKITQSWKGLDQTDPAFAYAYDNSLWHYHVGLPTFKQAFHGKYLTSDWVLHFQWKNWHLNAPEIALVDLYQHVDYKGKFWLPKPEYLGDQEPIAEIGDGEIKE
jgi:hypothetical protein